MKKIILSFIVAILSLSQLFSQQIIRNENGSVYKQCVRFVVTDPLIDISKKNPITHFTKSKESQDRKSQFGRIKEKTDNINTIDTVIQKTEGSISSSTIENFDGAAGQGYVPLDPNGMIGSNYYVQTVNSVYEVWNKNGTKKLIETDLSNLFGKFTCDDGDPVTMYDKFADRWVITEFQENEACGTNGDLIDTMMIAVSVTNDPTGSYYIYYFCPDNTDFADYPKYSIWADGYYQTCNCQNDKVVVYNRTAMLSGSPTAGFISIPYTYSPPWETSCGGGFYCPMMMYADGALPPYGTPCYLLDFTDPNWGSCETKNSIRIFSVSVNWTSKSGSISLSQTLPTASFNSTFPGDNSSSYRQDIDQPGSSYYASLDALDGFFSYRIPYIRWSSYNSAVMSNVVNVGTSTVSRSAIAGIRWYELRQDTTTKSWSIYQQGTWAPNDGKSRWNPGIAMDQNGNIGLEYTISGPSSGEYPSIGFTGRRSCDSLNQMTVSEVTVVKGNESVNTSNRWGDYSHLSVDPTDGITFWGNNMYANKSSSNPAGIISHLWSFQITDCSPTSINNISSNESNIVCIENGNILTIKGEDFIKNQNVNVEIYSIEGKKIISKNIKSDNNFEVNFDITNISKGIYLIRIGNDNFQRVIKTAIE